MNVSPFSRLVVLVIVAASLTGCTRKAREERLFSRAQKDFAAGAFDQAEVEYEGALHLALDPRVIGRLGILYSVEGRPLQAFPLLKRAADLEPGLIDVQARLAVTELEINALMDAREAAKRTLAADPANEEALLVLTESGRTKQDTADTRQEIADLRRGHPDCAGYHVVLGTLLLGQGEQPGAEAEFRKALELDPKLPAAYLELGDLFALRRNAAQSGENFRTAAQLAPVRSSLRMRYLDFLLATGGIEAAKKQLADIEAQAPDFLPALVYSMKLALTERRFADCAGYVQKILSRDARNLDALLERGALRLAQGDASGAVAVLEQTAAIYGRSTPVRYELALAYLKNGDLAKAEDQLNRALLLTPSYDQAKLLLAELELRKGSSADAVAALTDVIRRNPKVNLAYLVLARAYLVQKNPEQALATYRRMAAVFPQDPQVPYFMGLLLAQQNQRAEARTAFIQALKIAPNYGPAMDMLVNADLADLRIDDAAARVRTMTENYPKSAGPWLLRAKVDLVRHDLGATETDLLKAIDLDPKAQAAYIELAQVYLAGHQTAQAIAKLAALGDTMKNPKAYMELGQLHTSLDQFEAARADYEKLLAADPKFEPALNNLALLDADHLGRVDLAYDLAKLAREAAPNDPTAADTLGWMLFRKGDYHGALDLVTECALKEPGNAMALYHLGMIHYMLGEEDLAREAFQRFTTTAGTGAMPATLQDARDRLSLLVLDPATADAGALADLRARTKADPNDSIALIRLGGLQARLGAAAEAAQSFEAALKLAPRNSPVRLELARLYAGPLHDPVQARAMAKSAHDLAPNDAQISATLGRLLYQTGDYQWSLDLLREAAQNLTAAPDLQVDLALAEFSVGEVSEAEATLTDLLHETPAFARRLEADRLAAIMAAGLTPSQAVASLAEAKKLTAGDPTCLPALFVEAAAMEQQGNLAGAASANEAILSQDPLFTPAVRQLALIDLRLPGQEQKAYDWAVKARKAFPEDPGVATALGIVNYRRDDYAAAIRLLQDSLAHRADDAETLFYLGRSHLALKLDAEAKTELQRSLELGLTAAEAGEAKQALDEMK